MKRFLEKGRERYTPLKQGVNERASAPLVTRTSCAISLTPRFSGVCLPPAINQPF
jgi:hypothetical protein